MLLTPWDITFLLAVATVVIGTIVYYIDDNCKTVLESNQKYYERIRDFTDQEDERFESLTQKIYDLEKLIETSKVKYGKKKDW